MFKPAQLVKLYCVFHERHKEVALLALQKLELVQFFDVKKKMPLAPPGVEELALAYRALERLNCSISAIRPEKKPPLLEKLFGPRALPLKVIRFASAKELLAEAEKRLSEIEMEHSALSQEMESLSERKKSIEKELMLEKRALLKEAFLAPISEERMETVRALSKEESSISLRLLQLEARLEQFRSKSYSELLMLKERLEDLIERLEAAKNFGATQHTLTLGCWVQKDKAQEVIKELQRATGNESVARVEEAQPEDSPPTLLKNPRFLKPYEFLTRSYGLPRYSEIDPTPVLALAFTLFFGVMFADLGFGLALSLISLAALLKTTKRDETQRSINLLLIYLGFASAFFGVVFGEFFAGLLEVKPLWRNPADDVLLLLGVAIGVGILNISISILFRLLIDILAEELPVYPFSLLLILWSSIGIAVFGASQAFWFALTVGAALLLWKKKHEFVEELVALAANVLSYARIAVLYIVHVTIAKLLISAIKALPLNVFGLLYGTFLAALAVAAILVFDVFLIFITSLRLQWVEFFRRFYSGTGEKFEPFRAKREHIYAMP